LQFINTINDMDKITISLRIKPETRQKLIKMREESGLSYGVLVDTLVRKVHPDNQLFFNSELKSDRKIVDGIISGHPDDVMVDYPYEMTEIQQRRFDANTKDDE